jgi:hypothetical protein
MDVTDLLNGEVVAGLTGWQGVVLACGAFVVVCAAAPLEWHVHAD